MIEEIVVTASKREERLQDIPMAVSALSADKVQGFGATDFKDFARLSPGVSFRSTGPNGNKVVIRGVSSVGGAAPTSGFYLDETPISAKDSVLDVSTFDLSRIEVLRGPQGTLYGASSMGGTVRYITNKPVLGEFQARVMGGVGAIQDGAAMYNAAGMVNLPLGEKAALRISGSARHDGGWIDRQRPVTAFDGSPASPTLTTDFRPDPLAPREKNVNTLDVYSVRAGLRLEATENLTITPSVYYQLSKTGGKFDIDVPAGSFDNPLQLRLLDEGFRDEAKVYNLLGEYDLNGYNFVSSTSYLRRDRSFAEDTSMTTFTQLTALGVADLFASFGLPALTLFPTPYNLTRNTESFSQELRVTTPADRRLRATAGVYYDRTRLDNTAANTAVGFGAMWTPVFPGANELIIGGSDKTVTTQKAVFGEVNYDITPELTLTGGLRYHDDQLDSLITQDGYVFGGFHAYTHSTKDSGINPKLNLSYKPTSDTLFYAQAAKGYRQGGVNRPVPTSVCSDQLTALGLTEAPLAYKSDSLWSYEAGTKFSLFERRVTAAAAVYDIEWSNLQQRVALPGGSCNFDFTGNVGAARIKGAELEVTAHPIQGLSFTATSAYNDAKIVESSANSPAKVGDRLLDSPEWTFGFSGEYRRPFMNDTEIVAGLGYQYSSDVFGDFDQKNPAANHLTDFQRDGYGLADARLGVEGDKWKLTFAVNNLFNEKAELAFPESAAADVGGLSRLVPVRPRTYGVQFDQSF